MNNLTIVGAQFGDEGKGKIIDYLSQKFSIGVRFNGGENAGHTVTFNGNKVKFHLIPSSYFGAKSLLIGNGVVINLERLFSELEELRKLKTPPPLYISNLAHVVTKFHVDRDAALEGMRGKGQIGTTLKGIGPAYESKYGRYGIRIVDLLDNDAEEKLRFLTEVYSLKYNDEEFKKLKKLANYFSKNLVDSTNLLIEAIEKGDSILFEAAQGTFIDIDFGTYPYVTSSHTVSGAVSIGTGLPPKHIGKIMGVAKSYTTRVGEGYFPTEISGPEAEELRKLGGEYGATTGRPRRVGYLDLPMLKRSNKLNGFDYLSLTKVDVLGKFGIVKVAVSYESNGSEIKEYNPLLKIDKINYEEFEPWDNNYNKLENFVEFIENELRVPVAIVGTGEDREKVIVREEIN